MERKDGRSASIAGRMVQVGMLLDDITWWELKAEVGHDAVVIASRS